MAAPRAAQPISMADKLKARAAAARNETVAKRARPAARKTRRTHKRRAAPKTRWTFDL
jgi:hypothetical protein